MLSRQKSNCFVLRCDESLQFLPKDERRKLLSRTMRLSGKAKMNYLPLLSFGCDEGADDSRKSFYFEVVVILIFYIKVQGLFQSTRGSDLDRASGFAIFEQLVIQRRTMPSPITHHLSILNLRHTSEGSSLPLIVFCKRYSHKKVKHSRAL